VVGCAEWMECVHAYCVVYCNWSVMVVLLICSHLFGALQKLRTSAVATPCYYGRSEQGCRVCVNASEYGTNT
jgi:hypothetical protein